MPEREIPALTNYNLSIEVGSMLVLGRRVAILKT